MSSADSVSAGFFSSPGGLRLRDRINLCYYLIHISLLIHECCVSVGRAKTNQTIKKVDKSENPTPRLWGRLTKRIHWWSNRSLSSFVCFSSSFEKIDTTTHDCKYYFCWWRSTQLSSIIAASAVSSFFFSLSLSLSLSRSILSSGSPWWYKINNCNSNSSSTILGTLYTLRYQFQRYAHDTLSEIAVVLPGLSKAVRCVGDSAQKPDQASTNIECE